MRLLDDLNGRNDGETAEEMAGDQVLAADHPLPASLSARDVRSRHGGAASLGVHRVSEVLRRARRTERSLREGATSTISSRLDRYRLRHASLRDSSQPGQQGNARLLRRFRRQNPDPLPRILSPHNPHRQIQNGEENRKYAFDGELTDASIRDFLERYYRNELTPYIKSEKPFDKRDGHVRLLVGSDFEKVAFDPNVNVMVEFVVPVGRGGRGGP